MKKIILKTKNKSISKSKQNFEAIKKYLRVVNYISAAQLYLKDNFFLERELRHDDIKSRLLGHWGGATGVNFILAHLNFYLKQNQEKEKSLRNVMFVLGPGHAYPALAANLFMERVMTEFFGDDKFSKRKFAKNIYDFQLTYDKAGLSNLIKYFGTPNGFPTHASPVTPGAILEGGELGYSISNASGAVMDNPDLIAATVIGDGEFETASLATSLHSNKFINSKSNGVVLPIINLNGYKISGPTILGRMNDEDLMSLFTGYGYEPMIVDARSDTNILKFKDNYDIEKDNVHILMQDTFKKAFDKILKMKASGEVRGLPIIILKSDKGWTGPKYENKKQFSKISKIKIEGNYESHQVPFANAKSSAYELKELEKWLKSYKVEELFANDKNIELKSGKDVLQKRFKVEGELFLKEIEDIVPEKLFRLGTNLHVQQNGKDKLKVLNLPKVENILNFSSQYYSPMRVVGEYMKEIFKLNERSKNFRFFSPDETYSNKLDAIFKEESRAWMQESRAWDKDLSKNGRIIEMLSENTLIGMMMGYILTGRHAAFASYEAFVQVVSSMIDQYIKFLRVSVSVPWRGDVSGFNVILTASSWMQEHNGYSHQNPGFIDDMLNRNTDLVNVYFPADAIAAAYAIDEMIKSKDKVNLLCSAKDDERPILLSKIEAEKSIKEGMILLEKYSDLPLDPSKGRGSSSFGGTAREASREVYDFMIVGVGDYLSLECIAGIDLINKIFSKNEMQESRGRFKIGFLNIAKLSGGDTESEIVKDFNQRLKNILGLPPAPSLGRVNTKVFANFHGHPQTLERYFYDAGIERKDIAVRGYIERGGINTLLGMHIINKTSRYDVAEYILKMSLEMKKIRQREFEILIGEIKKEKSVEQDYIDENFADSERIKNWSWGNWI